MKVVLIIIIQILLITSCNNNSTLINDWEKCKQNSNVQSYLNFAFSHSKSEYFDSSIFEINRITKLDKRVSFRYNEDSNTFILLNNVNAEIDKHNLIVIDAHSNSCLYNDTLIQNRDSVNNKIELFISLGCKHLIFIYSDSLQSKKSWTMFMENTNHVLNKYKSIRDNYSISRFKNKYEDLDLKTKKHVAEKIPINFFLFFSNPTPPPPLLNNINYK